MSGIGRVVGISLVLFALSACGGGSSGGGDSGTQPPPSTPTYSVTTSVTGSGSGSISPTSRSVSQGSTTSFTISPASGSRIAGVSGCGGSLSGTTYTTGSINNNCTVTANFSLSAYTVTASAGAGGSISPGSVSVSHGATTSFTVTPSSGYQISAVSGCGGSLSGSTYTTGPITAACSVTASFTQTSTPPPPPPATYSIGGTVSGLTGTLNLQNNGADTLSISQNGNFVFPTRLADGSSYSVSIASSPSGQTCTVTNGSGIVSGGAVTNILVACSATSVTYTVTGQLAAPNEDGSGPYGTIEPATQQVAEGGYADFVATPDPGYRWHMYGTRSASCPAWQIFEPSGALGIRVGPVLSDCTLEVAFILDSTAGFSVGGSVSGLNGTLVLQNNGTDEISLSSEGAFSFPTRVAEGASYLVTVRTQPQGQTCSVSNASGTVSGSNVTDVIVDCVSDVGRYTVGGTVSGLQGTVTLQNNGQDDLVVSTDGEFVFSEALVDGSTYSVSIAIQPVGQTCSLSNEFGRISGADVLNVLISCNDDNAQYTVTAISDVGGTISPNSATVVPGETASFTVTPDPGYEILTIEGCGGSLAGSVYETGPIGADCTVTARFTPALFELIGRAEAGGVISPAIARAAAGDSVTFTATPDYGYEVRIFGGDCDGVREGLTYTVNPVSKNCEVFVSFRLQLHTLTARAGLGGSITPASLDVYHGSSANFIVTPDTGYSILSVGGCGGALEGSQFTIPEVTNSCEVYAEFVPNEFAVTSSAGLNGSVSPSFIEVPYLERARFTISPDIGYELSAASGCNGYVDGAEFVTGRISESCNVEVSFKPVDRSGSLLSARSGSGTVTLTWDDNGATSYNLLYSTVPNCELSNYSVCPDGTLVMNVTSPYTVSGLANDTDHWFKLESVIPSGAVVSQEASARPGALAFDGPVNSIVVNSAGTAYVGGEFTAVGVQVGSLFSVNADTAFIEAFPTVDGTVGVVPASDGEGWYVAGNFENVGGVPRRGLAQILPDGSVGNWAPTIDGEIETIAVLGNVIYLGGVFDAVDGVPRSNVAAVSKDGQVLPWHPIVNGAVSAIAFDAAHNIYIGGEFTSVNGFLRTNLAAFWADGSLFDEPRTVWNDFLGSYVSDLAVLGDTVYVAGQFSQMGMYRRQGLVAFTALTAEFPGYFTDWGPIATSRHGAPELTAANGRIIVWNVESIDQDPRAIQIYLQDGSPDPNFQLEIEASWISEVHVVGSQMYVAGLMRDQKGIVRTVAAIREDGALLSWNPGVLGHINSIASDGSRVVMTSTSTFEGDAYAVDMQARQSLAAISADGFLEEWAPEVSGTVSTMAMRWDGTLYVGGHFTAIDEQTRWNLAAFDAEGLLTAWAPSVDSDVRAMAVGYHAVYVGGRDFRTVNGVPLGSLSKIDFAGVRQDWDPLIQGTVEALGIVGSAVYVGGSFSYAGGVPRVNVAAVGLRDGDVLPFRRDSDATVTAITADSEYVYFQIKEVAPSGPAYPVIRVSFDGLGETWLEGANRSDRLVISSTGLLYGAHATGVTCFTRLNCTIPGSTTNRPVRAIAASNENLFFGGEFSQVNGEPVYRFSSFPLQ